MQDLHFQSLVALWHLKACSMLEIRFDFIRSMTKIPKIRTPCLPHSCPHFGSSLLGDFKTWTSYKECAYGKLFVLRPFALSRGTTWVGSPQEFYKLYLMTYTWQKVDYCSSIKNHFLAHVSDLLNISELSLNKGCRKLWYKSYITIMDK